MARGEWKDLKSSNSFNNHSGWRSKWCSYKRTTLLVCCINIVVALYVVHCLYTSLYLYPYNESQTTFKYSANQIRKMEESIQIRKASEPIELLRLVNQLKNEYLKERTPVKLPQSIKQMIMDEISVRLRGLGDSVNATEQQEAIQSWRIDKLREAKNLISGNILYSSIPIEAAGLLVKALKSDWPELSEEIGFWIPTEIIHTEHDDKPEGVEEEEILPGQRLPPECNTELHTDYGGDALKWGLTHPKESAYECCMACIDQANKAKPGEKKCNTWVYCPVETGCHSPDIYEHKNQECWLKYSEKPKFTFKDEYPESYRQSHPKAPLIVPWVAGVISV